VKNVDLQVACPNDYWFDAGFETLTGTASNYYGVTAKAQLVLFVSGDWSCLKRPDCHLRPFL